MTACANCYTTEGPFYKFDGARLCKNLKGQVHKDKGCSCRVSQCVQRREAIDRKRYPDNREV